MTSRWVLSLLVQAPLGVVVHGVCAKLGMGEADAVMAAAFMMLASWGSLAVLLLAIGGTTQSAS